MRLVELKPYSLLMGFVFVLLIIMWITYVPFPNVERVSDLEYPNQYVPAIAAAGENFRIFVNAERVWVGHLEVEIEQGFVKLPEDISPGWYSLTLLIAGVNNTRQNALYVAPSSSLDFTFVHMTDMHTPAFGGLDVEERKRVVGLINDLGPTFVVDTGDATDYGLEEQYDWYDWITAGLEMPLYNLPGNQETYSDPNLERYAHRLGPSNYFFYFGETLFVGGAPLHSPRSWGGFDEAQIRWVDDSLSKEAKLKFFMNHIPIVAKEGRDYRYVPWGWKGGHFSQIEQGYEQIVKILTREKVVNLVGHWHGYSHKFEYGEATFYNTPSVTRNTWVKEGPRFRLFRVKNYTIVFDNVIEFGKLDLTREYTTDNAQVKVRIVNKEGFSIPLTVHVKLSPAGYPYSTSLGEIVFASPSGHIWVKYEAPVGVSEIEVFPE